MRPDRPGNPAGAATDPYYANLLGSPAVDLDADAPVLRSDGIRRLDRRVLAFLAGAAALLVFAVMWLVDAAGSGAQPIAARAQAVVIPELPRTPVSRAAVPAPSGVGVPDSGPRTEVPALPVIDHALAAAFPAGPPQRSASAPSLLERRISDRDGQDGSGVHRDPYVQAMLAGLPEREPTATGEPGPGFAATSARHLPGPDTLLVRGTYIRCVLETRIVTDIPGYTSCVVTAPVYSINGRRLLLPKGSRVLGRYEREPTGPRVAVVWDRITTPDGVDVAMANPGVDGLGGAGHPGHYSAHWGNRIASALLVSLVGDAFKYAAAEHGPPASAIGAGGVVVQSPYESATARTMERLANQMLDNRRPPTVTIHQGALINVYVARDVDFSRVVGDP